MERVFTKNGKMRQVTPQQRKEIQGYLPFYSVDTREEADELIQRALGAGEFVEKDGKLFEVTLAYEQTLDNLNLAGERLAALHEQMLKENALTGEMS